MTFSFRTPFEKSLLFVIPLCFFIGGLFFDVSSQDSDHGAHLAIVQELISGRFWPLPYHGILGLHAPTAFLYEFFGLNPLRFWNGLFWGSLAWIFVCLYQIGGRGFWSRLLTLGLYFLVTLPLMLRMRDSGYHGQWLSMSFLTGSLWALISGRALLAWIIGLASGPIYPMVFVFLGPATAWKLKPGLIKKILIVFSFGVAGFLLHSQISRMGLYGGGMKNWEASKYLVGLMILAVVFMRRRWLALRPVFVFYALNVGILGFASFFVELDNPYYYRKVFYFLAVLAPVFWALHFKATRFRVVSFVVLMAWLSSQDLWTQRVWRLLWNPPVGILSRDFDQAQAVAAQARSCEKPFVWVRARETHVGFRVSANILYWSAAGAVDPRELAFREPVMRELSPFNFAISPQSQIQSSAELVPKLIESGFDCAIDELGQIFWRKPH
jgi:hypothetical protein